MPFCFDDDGPLEQCNECGRLVPLGDELCMHCGLREAYMLRDQYGEDPNAGCWSYSW